MQIVGLRCSIPGAIFPAFIYYLPVHCCALAAVRWRPSIITILHEVELFITTLTFIGRDYTGGVEMSPFSCKRVFQWHKRWISWTTHLIFSSAFCWRSLKFFNQVCSVFSRLQIEVSRVAAVVCYFLRPFALKFLGTGRYVLLNFLQLLFSRPCLLWLYAYFHRSFTIFLCHGFSGGPWMPCFLSGNGGRQW